jgi:hypothetical protein
VIWQSLTSKALARLDRSIPVVLPVAAVEQHGPHLPLATDRLIAEHFCRELDRELPDRVLILPTVAVGCSQHHMDFPGTLSVSHDGFMRYVANCSLEIRLVVEESSDVRESGGRLIKQREEDVPEDVLKPRTPGGIPDLLERFEQTGGYE